MSEWKEVRLGDVSTINAGGDAPRGNMSKVKNEKFFIPIYSNGIDNQGLYGFTNKAIIDRPACTITARGTIGVVFNRKEPFYPIVRLISVIADESIIKNDFLYYLLRNTRIKGDGSVQEQFTVPMAKDIHLKIPTSIENQDQITGILSSLDAKIETNNKLNEKLEEMAQAIFKSWFVDFEPFKDKPFHETELGMIPEGWEVGSLSDIATITMGQSPCGTSYNENGEGIIFYQGRTEFGFRFPSIRLYTTAPSRFAEVGSTLMSVRAPVGDINMALLRCCIGRGVASIKSNCDCDSYIYYLMKSLKKRFDIYNGEGTVFGSVGRDTLRGLLITIPPSSVISDFEMNISKIDSRIKTNELESQRLASLRDTLLPRLMSGELIV